MDNMCGAWVLILEQPYLFLHISASQSSMLVLRELKVCPLYLSSVSSVAPLDPIHSSVPVQWWLTSFLLANVAWLLHTTLLHRK